MSHMKEASWTRCLAWLGAGLMACAPAWAAAPSYRVEIIDASPEGYEFVPRDMNDRGTLAGIGYGPVPGMHQLTLYRNGRFSLLGDPGSLGGPSADFDIQEVNNRGEVLGHVGGGSGSSRPWLYSGGRLSLLPLPEGAEGDARVLDFNNAGHAVGYVRDAGNGRVRPFFFDGHASRFLDGMLPPGTVLNALNDRDEMAGSADYRPLLYSGGRVTPLAPWPVDVFVGDDFFGLGPMKLGNSGQLLIGYVIDRDKDSNDERGAYLLDQGRYTLVGGGGYWVADMNERGWVVGSGFDESADPMFCCASLWRDGRQYTLDDLKRPQDAGVELLEAYAVDARGRVLGLGRVSEYEYRYWLATPVPEAGTLGMLLAGLVGVGGVAAARRRRAAQPSNPSPASHRAAVPDSGTGLATKVRTWMPL